MTVTGRCVHTGVQTPNGCDTGKEQINDKGAPQMIRCEPKGGLDDVFCNNPCRLLAVWCIAKWILHRLCFLLSSIALSKPLPHNHWRPIFPIYHASNLTAVEFIAGWHEGKLCCKSLGARTQDGVPEFGCGLGPGTPALRNRKSTCCGWNRCFSPTTSCGLASCSRTCSARLSAPHWLSLGIGSLEQGTC
jgi:hypothetical protein